MYTDQNGMGLNEQISMLENTKEEIAQLQARLDHIIPRAEAYGIVCQILSLTGGRIMGSEERNSNRVIRIMEKRLEELKAQRQADKEATMKAAQAGRELNGLEIADRSFLDENETVIASLLNTMKLPHRAVMQIIGTIRATQGQIRAELEVAKSLTEAGSQVNSAPTSDRAKIPRI